MCIRDRYAVYRTVFDFNTLHILAADVQNTINLRIKKGGGMVMGHGFHLAVIQQLSLIHIFIAAVAVIIKKK